MRRDTATLPLFGSDQPLFEAADPPKLRPYQSRGIQTLRDRVRSGKRRILLVSPTGSGKTTIIASIIRTSSVPALFIADSEEIVDQCVKDLARVGISNVGVIRGDDKRSNPEATVQVASIQTLMRRGVRPPAGILLVDEAHLSASDSYQRLFEDYPTSIILGFTATPTRLDEKPLGDTWECMEIICTYEQVIKDGFVIAPYCYSAPLDVDLSTIKIVGGDYNEGELNEVMRNTSLIGNLLDHWTRLAHLYPRDGGVGLVEGPRRRTFIYAVGITHSLDICARFEAAGVRIAHLDGNTPGTQRRAILKAIECGELDAVTNVGVLLKGVDIPSVKCVLHARPTQSLVIWRQSVGRILRPWHPGCPRGCLLHPSVPPLLLDHAGNIVRLGFPHEDLHWELKSKATRSEKKPPTRICQGCFAYLPQFKRLCPYCGFEAPPAEDSGLVPDETNAQLQGLSTTPEAMRQLFFDTMVRLARKKGYKPGFAGARYKERYGSWPPWIWSETVKSSFASDPEWQANYETNVARKKQRELEKMKKELAKIEEPEDDDDIAF